MKKFTNKEQQKINVLAGKLTLNETACLFQKGILTVSNDSGPLHLSSAMGTPTIGLFGPETPIIYGIRGKEDICITADIIVTGSKSWGRKCA